MRLTFSIDSASRRVSGGPGGITGTSALDSYVGDRIEVEMAPGALPIGCLGDRRFATFDFAMEAPVYGRVLDAGGERSIVLETGGVRVEARGATRR